MDKLQLLPMVQAYTGIGVGLMIGLGAAGACIGVGIMCSRFLEAAARQPELTNSLQGKVFLLLGLIAAGLAAAEEGKRSLDTSAKQAEVAINQARSRAQEIISQAEKRSAQMIDEARNAAKEEGNREKAAAKAEIEQEVTRAREQLRDRVASLAVAGAEKILRREVDAKAHGELLESIKRQL